MTKISRHPNSLIQDLRQLITGAREYVARTVNSSIVMLYWQIGKRMLREVLKGKRADYGKEIVRTVSAQLVAEYGKGFTDDNIFRMIQFAELFPNPKIVGTLSRQLCWSHFVQLIPIKDILKREFYAEMCRIERWSVRQLRGKIGSMLYERTALSGDKKAISNIWRMRAFYLAYTADVKNLAQPVRELDGLNWPQPVEPSDLIAL